MKDIRLFTSQPVARFYDSLFLRLGLSFVQEPSLEAGLDEEIAYTKELLPILEEEIVAYGDKKIQGLAERIRGLLDTGKIREIESRDDKDTRFGHRTPTSTFCGYKNHLAMTEEGLIAGISITPGGEPDGQQLSGLIEEAQKNGVEVTEVIGDMTCVNEDSVDACREGVTLITKINPAAAAAAEARLEEGFGFSKDTKILQYLAGELTMRVKKREAKNEN